MSSYSDYGPKKGEASSHKKTADCSRTCGRKQQLNHSVINNQSTSNIFSIHNREFS